MCMWKAGAGSQRHQSLTDHSSSLPPLTEGVGEEGGGRNTNTDGQTERSKPKQMWP